MRHSPDRHLHHYIFHTHYPFCVRKEPTIFRMVETLGRRRSFFRTLNRRGRENRARDYRREQRSGCRHPQGSFQTDPHFRSARLHSLQPLPGS
ncbi:hypothetical protein WP1_293 [Pseudomonas phage WP1]